MNWLEPSVNVFSGVVSSLDLKIDRQPLFGGLGNIGYIESKECRSLHQPSGF